MVEVDTGESVKPLIAILFVTAMTLFFLAKTAFFGSMKKGDNSDAYSKIIIGGVAGTVIMYKMVNSL
jgi:hypothetical protein